MRPNQLVVKIVLNLLAILTSTCAELGRNCFDEQYDTIYIASRPKTDTSVIVPFRISIPQNMLTFFLLVSGNMTDSVGQLISYDGFLFDNPVLLNRTLDDDFGSTLKKENNTEFSGRVFFNNTDSPNGCLFIGHIDEDTGELSWQLTATVLGEPNALQYEPCAFWTKMERDVASCVNESNSLVNLAVEFGMDSCCSECESMNFNHISNISIAKTIFEGKAKSTKRGWLMLGKLRRVASNRRKDVQMLKRLRFAKPVPVDNEFVRYLRASNHKCCKFTIDPNRCNVETEVRRIFETYETIWRCLSFLQESDRNLMYSRLTVRLY
ncbi:hypothetical protein ACOME3_004698 [Neoechinorhynchus agilis]